MASVKDVDNLMAVRPEPEAQYHDVVRGDTLSAIARSTGDASKYPVIFEANKRAAMLTNSPADKIYPGQKLRISTPRWRSDRYF